jgi:membrane protease YdiL (CAAX protease family)
VSDAVPPAGWYPDPERPGALRWWDGAAWTEHRHRREPPGPVAAAAPDTGAGRDDEGEPAWRAAPPPRPRPRDPVEPARQPAAAAQRPDVLPFGWAVIVVGVWLGMQVIAGIVLGIGVVVGGGDPTGPVGLSVLTVLSLGASLVGVLAILRWRLGSWPAVVGARAPSWGLVAAGGVIGGIAPVAIGFATDGLARLLEIALPETPSQAILADLVDAPGSVVWLTGVAVVAIAPVLEELVFRRAVHASLSARLPTGVAVLLSAVAFAVVHVELLFAGAFGLLQTVGLVVLGAVFALLYERADGAWPSIAAHAAFNAVSLAAVLAFT